MPAWVIEKTRPTDLMVSLHPPRDAADQAGTTGTPPEAKPPHAAPNRCRPGQTPPSTHFFSARSLLLSFDGEQ